MFGGRGRSNAVQAIQLLCVWVVLINASVLDLSSECPAGARSLKGESSSEGGSCLLGGRVDASLSPILWLSFAAPGGSMTGAEVGIDVRGVIERAAGNLHVGRAHAKFGCQLTCARVLSLSSLWC